MLGTGFIGRLAPAVMAVLAIPATADAQQKPPTEQELRAKGARQMTGAEIRASRLGNTWYYLRLADSQVLPVYYRDERNRVAVIRGTKRVTLWWMEDDKGCDEAVTFVGHACSRLYFLNNQMHLCIDGRPNCDSVVRQVSGNPEKL